MDLYRGALGRLPDSAGYAHWLSRLRAAQCVGIAAVAAEANTASGLFLGGAEYAARARSDAQYVSDLYSLFMRRGADLAGQQHWIAQLTSGAITREGLRLAFQGSVEFQNRVARVAAESCVP